MARQVINIGTAPNSRTGDPIRTAFDKVNQNFTELYNRPTFSGSYNDLTNKPTIPTRDFNDLRVTRRYQLTGSPVLFQKPPNTTAVDNIDTGIALTRPVGVGAGLYNAAVEQGWNPDVSPANTEWNIDGWSNLDNVKQRKYLPFREVLQYRIGELIVGAELVMHDITNDKYYKIDVTAWGQGASHTGEVSYTRQLINTEQTIGVMFPDGTTQITAAVDASDLTDNFGLMNGPKTWTNPQFGKVWSIESRSGGIRLSTTNAGVDSVNTSVLLTFDGSSFYVPRDETTARIQQYWDGLVDGGYNYQRIVINGTEYNGFITTYNETGWLIQLDDGPVSAQAGDPVIVQYYGYPLPVKWFDAAAYPNSENFLGAIINYYAFVEGRGQSIGTVWMTATHDDTNDFDADVIQSQSGEYTDLMMNRRFTSQSPDKSLWMSTNSPVSEPVSIIWEAKMFYGQDGIVVPAVQ